MARVREDNPRLVRLMPYSFDKFNHFYRPVMPLSLPFHVSRPYSSYRSTVALDRSAGADQRLG